MTYRINIEQAVEQAVAAMLEDPDGRDVETERDDLLSVIYAWRDEAAPVPRPAATDPSDGGGERG